MHDLWRVIIFIVSISVFYCTGLSCRYTAVTHSDSRQRTSYNIVIWAAGAYKEWKYPIKIIFSLEIIIYSTFAFKMNYGGNIPTPFGFLAIKIPNWDIWPYAYWQVTFMKLAVRDFISAICARCIYLRLIHQIRNRCAVNVRNALPFDMQLYISQAND